MNNDNIMKSDFLISFSEDKSEWIKDDVCPDFLKDKILYHERSGVLSENGNKKLHQSLKINETVCVPLAFFNDAFGYSTDFDVEKRKSTIGNIEILAESKKVCSNDELYELSIVAEKYGTIYIPLKEFCENVLGKSVFYDNSVHGGGMFIISDKEIIFPDGFNLQSLNDYALYERPDTRKITSDFENSGYSGVHPRLMADASDFARIRQMTKTDENMKKWAEDVIREADEFVATPEVLIYELRDNIRLWYVSNDFIRRISALGMAYQLTGDKKYSDRAWREMESVANFPSWHPEHSIDVGAMAIGYALGYDWLYETYTE